MRRLLSQNFGPIRPPFGEIETFLGGKKEMQYCAGRCSRNFTFLIDKFYWVGAWCIHDLGLMKINPLFVPQMGGPNFQKKKLEGTYG